MIKRGAVIAAMAAAISLLVAPAEEVRAFEWAELRAS